MKKYFILTIMAIFSVGLGFVTSVGAVDIEWTDFSSWEPYALSGSVTLCDGKMVNISITDNTTSYVQTDGTTVGYPFFLEEHSVFTNVNDIDYPRFRTRAASAIGNFNNAAPNSYTMTWTFPTPLDHTNFFVVGQLLQGNVATIIAYAPDLTTVVNSYLVFEQLKAVKSSYTFYESLSWDSATGALKKATTTGSNSKYGFFSIPYGTQVSEIVIALADDGSRGKTADEVNYGIGCVLPTMVEIDVKPGSYPNCFNINGHGVIPVAILGSEDFDVYTIDVASVLFNGSAVQVRGKKEKTMCHYEDVSGDFTNPEGAPDGYIDLVCQFEDDPTQWTTGQALATLTGNLTTGEPIEGYGEVCITQEVPEE
jgi:hypothetical protein